MYLEMPKKKDTKGRVIKQDKSQLGWLSIYTKKKTSYEQNKFISGFKASLYNYNLYSNYIMA